MRLVVVPALSGLLFITAHAFDPHAYPQKVAQCEALNRQEGIVKEIAIHYVEVNPGAETTLVMLHGWPSLWNTWSNQIEEFERDYHLIAPDQRGFGVSTHPGDVESSGTMGDLVGDLACVLAHAHVHRAICLGHDWGAAVCWEAARMRPDMITAVAAAVLPYIPAADAFVPTAALVAALPRLAYQLFFQQHTAAAVAELDRDVRRTLRAALRDVRTPPPPAFLTSPDSFLYGWHDTPEIPPIPFLSPAEEDYMVAQFALQGFQNTLQFYTHSNRHGSWAFAHAQGNHTIPQPALSILPTEDPVADWRAVAQLLGSAAFVPRLTVETLPAAHWPQLEQPDSFNAILRRWLRAQPSAEPALEPVPDAGRESAHGRIGDEL